MSYAVVVKCAIRPRAADITRESGRRLELRLSEFKVDLA
ncbi:hypothetical protein J2Y48_001846 [Mycoplana sp. BE70]|nr:hypothetical protein [Mycoplana sp. BE70]